MLHRRRERLAALADAEAQGGDFWTKSFDEKARTKIVHAINDVLGAVFRGEVFLITARALILRDEGIFFLVDQSRDPANDFLQYVMVAPDDMMPTVIEAIVAALSDGRLVSDTGAYNSLSAIIAAIEPILREHRISFELVEREMVAFSSRELHVEVVAPTLHLLAGRTDLKGVETAYQNALQEISKGSAADAVTDAGTALQEMLVASGCEGNALGPLIRSARSKGLLGAHDVPMLDAIDRLLNWVSADRSETGDSHASNSPSVEDAWLIVHVVGAVIVRLSKGSQRPGVS